MTRPSLKRDIARVVRNGNCSGCGACAAMFDSVDMQLDAGFLRPTVSSRIQPASQAKDQAQLFRSVCPGVGVVSSHPGVPCHHEIVGSYVAAWRAHAIDPDVRRGGSSGGVITALTAWLVEGDPTAAAVAAAASRSDPTRTVPVRIVSREEAIAAAGSRYAPTSVCSELSRSSDTQTRVFVGKPCEVSALRQMMSRGFHIEGEPVRLSFFCAGTPSQKATDALVSEVLSPSTSLSALTYRGNGWPGRFTAVADDGRIGSLSYEDSWGRVLGRNLQTRCKLCVDGTGEDADVAIGDYWEVDDRGFPCFTEQDGSSIAIARTQKGLQLIMEASREGVIHVEPVDMNRLASIQPLQRDRARGIAGRIWGRRLAGRAAPRYRGFRLFMRVVRHPILNFRALAGTWLRTMRGRM